MIPNSFGINDGNGAARADTEAVRLGAINQRFRPDEVQLLEPAFQKFPRLETFFFRGAMWLGLVGTEEDMPSVFLQTQGLYDRLQFFRHKIIVHKVEFASKRIRMACKFHERSTPCHS